MGAGLPNITGRVYIYVRAWNGEGAFYTPTGSAANAANTGSVTFENTSQSTYFDASRVSGIYGNSATVTPLSQSTLYILKY